MSAAKIPSDERIASCTAALAAGIHGGVFARRAYLLLGRAHFDKGDLEAAVADFSQAIQLFPSDVQAYEARAATYLRHRDFDLAIADYGRVIEINPTDSFAYAHNAYLYRGEAYGAKEDFGHSIADLTKAIEINPNSKFAYCARGHAYIHRGDLELAIADYSQAIQLDPDYKAAYGGRAAAYKLKGDLDRAMSDYDRLVQLDPKDAKVYRVRGIAKFSIGSLTQALEDLNSSSALDPKDFYTVLWLDLMAKRSGQPSRLPELAAQLDMTKWPAPIVRLFLGEITPTAMLEAAEDNDARKRRDQVCEANFFGGEVALREGAKEEAVRMFRSAVAGCAKTFIESSAAGTELKTMNASP